MLKGVPTILCPELLKTLDEMGHNDVLVLGDGNFPGSGIARAGGAKLIRADGIGAAEMLEAILQVMPLDEYVEDVYKRQQQGHGRPGRKLVPRPGQPDQQGEQHKRQQRQPRLQKPDQQSF